MTAHFFSLKAYSDLAVLILIVPPAMAGVAAMRSSNFAEDTLSGESPAGFQ